MMAEGRDRGERADEVRQVYIVRDQLQQILAELFLHSLPQIPARVWGDTCVCTMYIKYKYIKGMSRVCSDETDTNHLIVYFN